MYTSPTRNPTTAVQKDTCHVFKCGKASRMTVKAQPLRAIRLPTPSTNNMKKNKIAKS